MIRKTIGDAWKILPRAVRKKIVRLTQPKFTVSAAAVVRNEQGAVLLLDHVFRAASGWGLPGGFLEHGEQPEDGIRREIREEIGIELEGLELFRIRTVGTHIEMIFSAHTHDEPIIKTREVYDFRWFDPASLPSKLNAAQKHIIAKVLKSKS